MPPISLRVTPIHHLAEVFVGNPYWIFNEREYNAIQSQWVCQCPHTLHTHTYTGVTHMRTHTHTLVVLFEIALRFTNSLKGTPPPVHSRSHTPAAVGQTHNRIYETHPYSFHRQQFVFVTIEIFQETRVLCPN